MGQVGLVQRMRAFSETHGSKNQVVFLFGSHASMGHRNVDAKKTKIQMKHDIKLCPITPVVWHCKPVEHIVLAQW